MAVLLVGMSVAAILMTAAMPVWKQMSRREKEAELIFRGQQYVRAIGLFQRRAGPGVLPPSVDVLVTGRFLRKAYKDPITNEDFDLLSPVSSAGQPGGGAAGGGRSGVAGAGQPVTAPQAGRGATSQPSNGTVIGASPNSGRGAAGGIMGVASKSKEESLRVFNGRTHYNEWQFVFVQQAQAGGAGAPGGQPNPNAPGGRGQRGQPSPFGVGGGRAGQGRQGQPPPFSVPQRGQPPPFGGPQRGR